MRLLDRYLANHLLRGYFPILLIFLSIFSLIVLVDEIDEVGKGRYTFWKASEYVVLTLPSRVVLLAPFVALLGSILALGGLANGRELTAMQAAGISPVQLAGSVMKVGLVFMLLVACFQEYVNPALDQQAILMRSVALSKSMAYQGEQGLWFREGSQFVRIKKLVYGGIPQGIDIFEFNEDGEMTMVLHAQSADVDNPRQWVLRQVQRQLITGHEHSMSFVERFPWNSPLQQEEMRLLTLPASSLSVTELFQYIQVLQRKNQNSLRYELAFWDKLFMPLTTGLMILVSFPFAFGPLRDSTVGKRMVLGIVAGVGFYLFTEVVKHLGVMVGVSPFLTTALPIFCLSALAFGFWRKCFF